MISWVWRALGEGSCKYFRKFEIRLLRCSSIRGPPRILPFHSLARSCYNHDSTGFSRILHHPGRASNYHPQFEDVYLGNSLTTLPVYESQHSGYPSQFHDILLLQALAREEARRRILVDRQRRRVEHARAQALTREREEYLR